MSCLNHKWIISSPLVWLSDLTLLIRQVEKFLARLPGEILSGRKNEICLLAQVSFKWPHQLSSHVILTNPAATQAHHATCCVTNLNECCKRDFISLHIPLKWQKLKLSVLHQHNFLRSIYAWKGMFVLITCFIKYFDVRWIESRPRYKKTTVTNWVPRGCRVRATASGVGA